MTDQKVDGAKGRVKEAAGSSTDDKELRTRARPTRPRRRSRKGSSTWWTWSRRS